jgi:hypothetical protein
MKGSRMVFHRLLRVHYNLHNARNSIQVSAPFRSPEEYKEQTATSHTHTLLYPSERFDRQQRTPFFTESLLLLLALVFAASTLTVANSVTVCQSLNRRRAKRTPHATCLLQATAIGRSSPAPRILHVYVEVAISGYVLQVI